MEKESFSQQTDGGNHRNSVRVLHHFFPLLNPLLTAVPFWGWTAQVLSSLSPKTGLPFVLLSDLLGCERLTKMFGAALSKTCIYLQ